MAGPRESAMNRITKQACDAFLLQVIDGGLLRADNTLFYPILDGIPLLLPDEAISLAEIA